MNLKNARIEKLWRNGLRDPKAIAKKLGLANDTRVIEGLVFLKLIDAPKS